CGPFYSTREWLPAKGRIETMAEYTARVENDLATGLKIMQEHGFADLKTMAMPFGEYGQTTNVNGEDNLSVERQLAKIMPRYFVSIFIQSGHAYTPYSTPVERAIRFEPHARPGGGTGAVITTLPALYHYLYHGDPTVIQGMKNTCGQWFEITI